MFGKGLRINYCLSSALFLIVLFFGSCFEFALSKNTNYSGFVRNLASSVFEETSHVVDSVGHGPLKFNITWEAPLNSRKPSSYSILITSVNTHDDKSANLCPEETLFHTTWSDDRCQVLLPENKFLSDAPELSIRPTCTYVIQVFANPRSNPRLKVPEIIITVPECVGKWCGCKKAEEYLPVPEVNIVSQNSEKIVIEWNARSLDSQVHSYVISFGVPFLISNSRLPVYNISKIAKVPSTVTSYNLSFNVTDLDITAEGNIYVTAEDAAGCLGKSGTILLERPIQVLTSVQRPDRFQWFLWIIVIGIASMIIGAVFSLLYNGRVQKYKLIWSNRPMSRIQGLIGLSRLRSRWVDSTLRERNILYVEQEIQDAIDRGEADEYEVSYERLKFIRELGKGQFGNVYLGTLEGHRESIVAIKITNCLEASNEPQARRELLAEIETMKKAGSHPNLVRLVATCTLPNDPVCLVLEYLEGGDLLAHLHRLRDCLSCDENPDSGVSSSRSQRPSLSETVYTTLGNQSPIMETFPDYPAKNHSMDSGDENVETYVNEDDFVGISDECNDLDEYRFTSFALDIARGMEHLETRGIIHRDLAARNVLLTTDMTLKISDFGLSRNDGVYIIGNGDGGVRRLPVRWMAPEALRDRSFTSKSDVWSFAIVLWEIGTLGAFPYSDVPDDMLLRHVLRDEGRLERPENITSELYDIMRSCWSSRPENRPSFGQLVHRLSTLGEPSPLFLATSNPCYSLLPTMMTMEENA